MFNKEYKVLVHPDIKNPEFSNYYAIWQRWIDQGAYVVRGGEGLNDTQYSTSLSEDTTIVLGGQRCDVCVASHAIALLETSRLQKKELYLAISGSAVYGGSAFQTALQLTRSFSRYNIKVTRKN